MTMVFANNQWYTDVHLCRSLLPGPPGTSPARAIRRWLAGVQISGAVFLAKCGIRVLNWSGSEVCIPEVGCTGGLITGQPQTTAPQIVQHPELGSAGLLQTGRLHRHHSRGLLVAGKRCMTMLAELISNVKSHMNVTVATTP